MECGITKSYLQNQIDYILNQQAVLVYTPSCAEHHHRIHCSDSPHKFANLVCKIKYNNVILNKDQLIISATKVMKSLDSTFLIICFKNLVIISKYHETQVF